MRSLSSTGLPGYIEYFKGKCDDYNPIDWINTYVRRQIARIPGNG